MKKQIKNPSFVLVLVVIQAYIGVSAQNPVIRNQFTADPTARVFNGKVYVFPSHDISASDGKGRPGWFCMEDYHVFSSENLTNWTDHGIIVSQNKVNWVDSASYSMWAPDCIERDGKYYFYFPARGKQAEASGEKGFSIGVAIAYNPEGPYVPQPEPIGGVCGIDPNVFIDKDGQAYLYWSQHQIFVAKLKDNMLELDSEPKAIANLPEEGLKEGPFMFERNGIYYLTFPHVENKIERLEYATGRHPLGPFEMAGVIMDESPMNCWTNHHSLFKYNNQWYLFYHQNEYSPAFDKCRSTCIDSVFFNVDGTIQKVTPSRRGVGLTNAKDSIEIDRYSAISSVGARIDFIDSLNTFNGWKTVFSKTGAWVRYNAVDFGNKKLKNIRVRAIAEKGSTLQIRLNNESGPLLCDVKVPESNSWITVEGKLTSFQKGIQNLVVVSTDNCLVEIDWVKFR
ncbi:MAG: family 43 glycosylhydrolase [Breznakibacter sp.]